METARHEPPPDTACRDPPNPKTDTACRDPRNPNTTLPRPPAAREVLGCFTFPA
jgi:hypothetical protein